MKQIRITALALAMICATADAHDIVKAEASSATPPYAVTPIFQQAMSESELAGYEMLVMRLDILPGGEDAAPHRHDADLFVYVLEGSVEVELDGEKSTYNVGSMFHEPRNIMHSLLRNTSDDKPASVLASFVIKTGREALVPLTQ